jgi:exonuclease VII small subunit
MSAKQNNSTNKLSFEEAIKQLTGIVTEVEQGRIPLAESLGQYDAHKRQWRVGF